MAHDKKLITELEEKVKLLRRDIILMIKAAGMGWIGGSFSEAEIVTALIFHHMKHDPRNSKWLERDRLIISKGHCCEALYAALGEAGYFPKKEFESYGHFGSILQAHVDRRAPGVEYSGGSLGLGLSFALGEALVARIGASKDDTGRQIPRYRVFCIIGDGECNEGEIWEAAMAAAHYKVDNLIAIMDNNNFQTTGTVSEVMNLEPLLEKWRAFGWDVAEINGHDFSEILCALEKADKVVGKPHVIVAHTFKAKGLPSFENSNALHFSTFRDDVYAEAMKVLK